MRSFVAFLSAVMILAGGLPANAKVHVVSKGGLRADDQKLLDELSDGKWMYGCVVRGVYAPSVTEEGCDLLKASGRDAVWIWVKP